jgi:hypothetical protein
MPIQYGVRRKLVKNRSLLSFFPEGWFCATAVKESLDQQWWLFIVFWIAWITSKSYMEELLPRWRFPDILLTPNFSQDTTSEYSDLTNPTKIMSTDQYIS